MNFHNVLCTQLEAVLLISAIAPFIGASDKRLNSGKFYRITDAASVSIRAADALSLQHIGLPVAHALLRLAY